MDRPRHQSPAIVSRFLTAFAKPIDAILVSASSVFGTISSSSSSSSIPGTCSSGRIPSNDKLPQQNDSQSQLVPAWFSTYCRTTTTASFGRPQPPNSSNKPDTRQWNARENCAPVRANPDSRCLTNQLLKISIVHTTSHRRQARKEINKMLFHTLFHARHLLLAPGLLFHLSHNDADDTG